ncbi:hypothetical protein K505DRAFT_333418 [Melanomma pulvis-pyrius CBS 109.77]|uniref:RING-type domain-containing protein n=1 Tax=Melanomma pulvis-pyrius CBS 109.77 TaxID=1314802 RepID=A0A6A6XQ35_9PLEO|nr:hypothetical protein K505DRAFT_333418 [Melanomma pulvis-pyrius CBS 109.77]
MRRPKPSARAPINSLCPYTPFPHEAPECSICLDPLSPSPTPNPAVRILSCCHAFHAHCIHAWLERCEKHTCPVCRKHLSFVPADAGQGARALRRQTQRSGARGAGSVDAGGTGLAAEAATVGGMVGGVVVEEEGVGRRQASRQAGGVGEELERGGEGGGRRQRLKRRVSMWFRRSKNGQARGNVHDDGGNVARIDQ